MTKTPEQKLARLLQRVYGMKYTAALAYANDMPRDEVLAESKRLQAKLKAEA